MEDNRSAPIKSIKVGEGRWISNLPNIIKYIKIRYQEWLFAGGELSGEKCELSLDPEVAILFGREIGQSNGVFYLLVMNLQG